MIKVNRLRLVLGFVLLLGATPITDASLGSWMQSKLGFMRRHWKPIAAVVGLVAGIVWLRHRLTRSQGQQAPGLARNLASMPVPTSLGNLDPARARKLPLAGPVRHHPLGARDALAKHKAEFSQLPDVQAAVHAPVDPHA